MKMLFQTIGVLVHYNYALPYYLIRTGRVNEVYLLSNVSSILMGGWYYFVKARGRMRLKVTSCGIGLIESRKIMRLLNKIAVKRSTSEHFDVTHLNSRDEIIDALLKARNPKIFVLHGSPDFMNKVNRVSLEELYSKVDAFVVASMHAAKKLYELYGLKPSHVIHHGVDVEIFNPTSYPRNISKEKLGIPACKKVVLWNARMSPEKRLETLIFALPYVIKDFKDFLVLVKTRTINKSYEAKILRLVSMLRVNNYIIFDKSWTPLVQMPVYYRAADVFVNTSITEAFGSLTMLEAMACGIPTIANNASSNPEALGDGGLLYDTDDPNDLAEKLLKVLVDDKLAKILSRKAYDRIKRELTLRKQAEEYVRLYSSLL
jgi:spore coat protein SA